MSTTHQPVHTGKKAVDRVLPTHELRARQRRKQVIPNLSPEPQPQGPKPKTDPHQDSSVKVLESFYSQFPPQQPLV